MPNQKAIRNQQLLFVRLTGVSLKTLKNICTVLGCSADTLLGIGVNDSGDAERFALKCSIDTLSDQTVLIARKILPEIESTVRDK